MSEEVDVNEMANVPGELGDMDGRTFREGALGLVDWIGRYLAGADDRPILSRVRPRCDPRRAAGIRLGRRFRALKLWMVMRYFGAAGLRARIAQHIRLACLFAAWIEADPDFELRAPASLSLVCFRAAPRGVPEHALDARKDVCRRPLRRGSRRREAE
jgi:hypothetical protein